MVKSRGSRWNDYGCDGVDFIGLFHINDHILGTNGRGGMVLELALHFTLLYGLGLSRQDVVYRSWQCAAFGGPDRRATASGETIHVQSVSNFQASIVASLPDL